MTRRLPEAKATGAERGRADGCGGDGVLDSAEEWLFVSWFMTRPASSGRDRLRE